MLDLLERTEQESAQILHRYLERERVASGDALATARKEYRNKNRRSTARQAIPAGWSELVEKGDEQLVELLTDAVESKVGVRPEKKDILTFLSRMVTGELFVPVRNTRTRTIHTPVDPKPKRTPRGDAAARIYALVDGARAPRKGSVLHHICNAIIVAGGQASFADISDRVISGGHLSARKNEPLTRKSVTDAVWHGVQRGRLRVISGKPENIKPTGYSEKSNKIPKGSLVLDGKKFSYGTAKEAMVFILRELAKADSTFLRRCSRHPAFRGRKRRYLARSAMDLFPDRPDLIGMHVELPGGWVVGTNLNNRLKMSIIKGAAEVAGITFGC